MQANFEQAFMNSVNVNLPKLSYQSQGTFATNFSPLYQTNTFEGYQFPSFSRNGTAMMTDGHRELILGQTVQLPSAFAASTFEFPETSTDILYSPQLLGADLDIPPLHEQPFPRSPPNRTFNGFH